MFPARKKVIFVHGCFWHGHNCKKGKLSKSRTGYWAPKIEANASRDLRNVELLRAQGWDVLIIWQCELKDGAELAERLSRFVDRNHFRSTTDE